MERKKPKSKLQKKKDNHGSMFWRNKADNLWKLVIRKNFGYKCAICSKSDGKLDSHHLVSKDVLSMRHDPMNGILLCVSHHKFSRDLSAHKGTIGFVKWMMENRVLQWAYVYGNWKIPKDWKKDYEKECEDLNRLL